MACPISVGDVLMLSRLAYRLARALGPDRHKVPKALQDIKHQLLAMGNALSFCWLQENEDVHTHTIPAGRETNIDAKFADMLSGCQASLQRLERLISKYSCLDTAIDQGSNDVEACKTTLLKNAKKHMKKLRFLLEDKELETIRKDISIHIEAINLAISGKVQSVSPVLLCYMCIEIFRESKSVRHERHQLTSQPNTWYGQGPSRMVRSKFEELRAFHQRKSAKRPGVVDRQDCA